MEGEKLLQRLKDGANVDSLLSDVKVYLAPIRKQKALLSDEAASKCGPTALKMLRACVQSISSLTVGSHHLASITSIAHACYEGIRGAKSRMKISPLSLEKVLFHIMLQLVNKSLLMDALSFAEYLYLELKGCRHMFENAEGMDNEFDTIAKQAFNQLWKACAHIEESSKSGVRHVLVLSARRWALSLLMLTKQETAWVAERALRAGVEMERHSGKDASCSDHLCHFFGELISEVLATLQRKPEKTRLESEPGKVLGPVLELCLQYVKHSIVTSKQAHAVEAVSRVKQCCTSSTNHSQDTTSSKLVCAISNIISVILSLSDLQANESQKPKASKSKNIKSGPDSGSLCQQMHHSSDVIAKCLETGDIAPAVYQPAVDACELLRKQLDSLTKKGFLDSHREIFQTGYQVLSLHMDVLQSYKEHLITTSQQPKDAYRGMSLANFTTRLVQKQLSTLNFLASLTIQELTSTSGAEIAHCKEEFGNRALTICKKTKAVMEDVSHGGGGGISVNEHRWLGGNAFNLGLICYKKSWYDFAQTLLRLSCEQFQMWCATENGLDMKKVCEIQLTTKYELLVDCQRRAGNHRDALTTIALSLLVVPGLKINDITGRAEQWVKCKRDELKKADDPDLRNRTILDECQEMETDFTEEQLSVIASALHEELRAYKTQRHDTSVEEYSVIQDLLRMYAADGCEAERAGALVQLARLVFSSSLDTECTLEEYCTQAIQLLENLPEGTCQTHQDLLAQAKFWLYACQLETCIMNSKSSPSTSSELNVDLTQEMSSVDLEDDSVMSTCTLSHEACLEEPLQEALAIWSRLLQVEPLDLEAFQDPASTLQCLTMAAEIMAAWDKPLEEIWVLGMLSKAAHSFSSPAQAIAADVALSRVLARVGLADHAAMVIGRAEEVLPGLTESQKNSQTTDIALSKCLILLYSGQIPEFETAFVQYLNNSSQKTKRRNCQTYLKSAFAKELHSIYLTLPISQRKSKENILTQDEFGDDLSPLDLLTEAMRLRMGVAKIVMGTEMNESSDTSDNDAGNQTESRWLVLAAVLQSLSHVANLFCQQGCVREAQCYITEGMSLAQKFQLPRRYARFLQQLTEVMIKWGQEDESRSALANMKTAIAVEKHCIKPKPAEAKPQKKGKGARQKGKSKQKTIPCKTEESDEEDFIRSRPLSFSRSLAGRESVDLSNSPTLKRVSPDAPKLPDYIRHHVDCGCNQCMDVSQHELEFAYRLCLAEYSMCFSNYGEALSAASEAKKLLEFSRDRFHHTLEKKLILISNMKNPSVIWTYHEQDLAKVLIKCAQVEVESGSLEDAYSTIQEGIKVCESNTVPLLDPSVGASLHFLKAVADIKQRNSSYLSGVFDISWTMGNKKAAPCGVDSSVVDDVSLRLNNLSLSVASDTSIKTKDCNPTRGLFQSMLDTSSTRPEVTRKRDSRGSDQVAVLPEELGLFSDVTLDDTDSLTEVSQVKVKQESSKSRSKSAVQVTTKKGAMNFQVAKKPGRTSKKASNESKPTTIFVDDADGIFAFDEESTKDKKKKSSRAKSRKGITTQVPSLDTGNTNNEACQKDDPLPINDSCASAKIKAKHRGRGRGAKKVAEVVQEEPKDNNQEILQMVEDVMADFHDAAATKTDSSIDVKPKRGRGRQAKESSTVAAKKETKPRGRRGRLPNVENTRGIPDPDPTLPLGLDDSIEEMLPIDSPLSSSPQKTPGLKPKLDFAFDKDSRSTQTAEVSIAETVVNCSESSFLSESCVDLPLDDISMSSSECSQMAVDLDKSTSMLLSDSQEDFDEVEVPRAGSDSEDTSYKGRRKRGAGAKRNTASGKPKGEKVIVEDVETLRGCSKDKAGKQSKSSAAGAKKLSQPVNREDGPTDIVSIEESLMQAYNLIKHLAPVPLYRQVCQLLALCAGDKNPVECSHYLARAASVTLRHQKLASLNKKLRKLRKAAEKEDDGLLVAMGALSLNQTPKMEEERLQDAKKLFSLGAQDKNIIKNVSNSLPEDYTVCQLSVIPTTSCDINSLSSSSQLVLTRLQKGQEPLVIRLPMVSGENIGSDFEKILSESKDAVKETDKKIWWTTRQRLDEEMQNLTKDMENNLLGCWKGLLAGSYGDKKVCAKLKALAQKLHKSIQGGSKKGSNSALCECLIDSYPHLSQQQAKEALASLSGYQPGSEALTLLAATLRDLAKDWEKSRPAEHRNLVILILDTAIQQLPWESIPVLEGWPVCRLPNVHFLLSHLRAGQSGPGVLNQGVNADRTYYVLNPTGDLANTQKTFHDWFKKENGWRGVVGRAPTKTEYTSALTDHDLFVFCGHGTGREFLTGDDIQRLTCKAATLLIGCSSGKLLVNGCLDAHGMALNYLLAECPCVVANLWDVTDRDIDRFLEYLLKAWLATSTKATDGTHQSLACLLNEARQACKLKHLIGYAPVIYGLPVTMKDG